MVAYFFSVSIVRYEPHRLIRKDYRYPLPFFLKRTSKASVRRLFFLIIPVLPYPPACCLQYFPVSVFKRVVSDGWYLFFFSLFCNTQATRNRKRTMQISMRRRMKKDKFNGREFVNESINHIVSLCSSCQNEQG